MKFIETPFEGLLLIEHQVWEDDRGYFMETYQKQRFEAQGISLDFVQDNLSYSHKGVLRGMHAQSGPQAQGKLVRVLRGKVLDVVIDIRKAQPTYGQAYSVELSEHKAMSFWVPPGFLHGFIALEDHTIFTYKVTGFYDKAGELGIRWDDPSVNFQWPLPKEQLIISEKDQQLPFLSDIESPF
jgi:dTDP-4-dehydrorhamnose 3,5-epimerase